jgi:hypothetical protein
MASRADIAHRYSFLNPRAGPGQFSSHDANGFYRPGNFPDTRCFKNLTAAWPAIKHDEW